MGLHPVTLPCLPTCAGGGGRFQRLQKALQWDVGQQLPQGVPAPAMGHGHGGGSGGVVSTRQGTSVWWPVHIWKATSVSSMRAGISPRRGQVRGPERSLQAPCLCPRQDLDPQKQSQHQETPPCPLQQDFSPSVRNSQLQEDALPGRQAPGTQEASSMSSPLSLGGEHRAGDHTQTRTASPLAGSRGFIIQPPPPR